MWASDSLAFDRGRVMKNQKQTRGTGFWTWLFGLGGLTNLGGQG